MLLKKQGLTQVHFGEQRRGETNEIGAGEEIVGRKSKSRTGGVSEVRSSGVGSLVGVDQVWPGDSEYEADAIGGVCKEQN